MIDVHIIKASLSGHSLFRGQCRRPLFIAPEALTAGRNGTTGISQTTGVMRSSFDLSLAELQSKDARTDICIDLPFYDFPEERNHKITPSPDMSGNVETLEYCR